VDARFDASTGVGGYFVKKSFGIQRDTKGCIDEGDVVYSKPAEIERDSRNADDHSVVKFIREP
jgi:hypothetical protein